MGLLIILTVLTYLGLFYFWVLKPYLGGVIFRTLYKPLGNKDAHSIHESIVARDGIFAHSFPSRMKTKDD